MGQNYTDWLTVTPLSGFGNGVITVSASTLQGLQGRLGLISIGNNELDIHRDVSVSQGYIYEYLTIDVLTSGNFKVINNMYGTYNTLNFEVSLNGGDWESITITGSGYYEIRYCLPGYKIRLKGASAPGLCLQGTDFDYNVYGNALSLIYNDDYIGQDTISRDFGLAYLFRATNVIDASNLIIPVSEITGEGCFFQTFYSCKKLTTPPSSLPATTLSDWCYNYMFYGCSAMTSTPELPATTLSPNCYNYMFQNCKSITSSPILSAQTINSGSYFGMFKGCSNLNNVVCLATQIINSSSTDMWLDGVKSTGTFTKAANMTGWPIGPNGIPSNWTIQNA